MKREDLTGRKFGYLTVLRRYATGHYHCQCDCGNYVTVTHKFLRSDRIKSCGCKDYALRYLPGTEKLYNQWKKMILKVRYRADCGVMGELIHPDWLAYKPFAGWAVSIGYTDGMILAQVPVGKSFSPLNCQWEWKGKPRRSFRRKLTNVRGVLIDLRKLAADCGVPYPTLYMRLRHGWTLLDAITLPVRRHEKTDF